MPPDPRRVLGCRVDSYTRSEALTLIRQWAGSVPAHQLVTANTLMLLAAQKDPELRRILDEAALVWPESAGLSWAGRFLRRPFPDVIPGIDFMLDLCAQAEQDGRAIFLLGAKPGVAAGAALRLTRQFSRLKIAGTHHGYFQELEQPDVISTIRQSGASYAFVAMTVPNQEKWIWRHRDELGVPIIMGVGGSFDVLSGHLKRAPVQLQRAGLEWLYRLYQEPWRWRRIAQLPVFVYRVIRTSLSAVLAAAVLESSQVDRLFEVRSLAQEPDAHAPIWTSTAIEPELPRPVLAPLSDKYERLHEDQNHRPVAPDIEPDTNALAPAYDILVDRLAPPVQRRNASAAPQGR